MSAYAGVHCWLCFSHLQVQYTNNDQNGLGHNIDFHAVIGPGGGATALYAEPEQTRVGIFKLLHPGLFIYHCELIRRNRPHDGLSQPSSCPP